MPEDDGVPLLLRASVLPVAREDAPTPMAISTAFLAALVPMSTAAEMLWRALSLKLRPRSRHDHVPKLAIPNADFVWEREAIPVSEASPASIATLSPSKIKSIVLATWELLWNPSAEDLLRQMLIESVGPALDEVLLSTAAATSERPAGLLNGIPPLASAGNLTDDLVALSAIAPVSGKARWPSSPVPTAAAINLLPGRCPIRS